MLLRVENLSKIYNFKKHFYLKKESIPVFEDVNFILEEGKNLLVTGESGSGKTSLAKIICMLEKANSGKVFFENQELSTLSFKEQRQVRKKLQYVFQDQKLALNPYKKVKNLLFSVYDNFDLKPNLKELEELFEIFEFDKTLLMMKSSQLSGGQASRLGLIRSLILKPKLLILDEITSPLDLITSRKIIDYLKNLQQIHTISYIFISHKEELLKGFCQETLNLSLNTEKVL